MKLWSLSRRQYVVYNHHRIHFCRKSRRGGTHRFTLRMDQFWNLDDLLYVFPSLWGHYPLGRGVWLKQIHEGVRLESQRARFEFRHQSWFMYKKAVHWRVRSFLRHGRHRTRRQHHARAPARCASRFGASPSPPLPAQQTPPRSPSNASDHDDLQAEPPSVSQRCCPSHGQSFSFRSAVNDLRAAASPPATPPPATYETINLEEYGSVCSIDIDDSTSSD